MRTIFIQGDRDAKGAEEAARRMATVFREAGIHLLLGAYGELVKIFTDAGCAVTCHGFRANERGKCPSGVTFVDCTEISRRELSVVANEAGKALDFTAVAWGMRIGLLLTANAYCFFPGREGTLAHLFPCIAFAVKHNKQIVFVGWQEPQLTALHNLLCETEAIGREVKWPDEFAFYGLQEAGNAANFLRTILHCS